ncbi:MAG: hypothetical protein KGL39_18065 [Patescibacteria group bacterium]|nr:hypothetical protein [Patescibacteria group bacterium]
MPEVTVVSVVLKEIEQELELVRNRLYSEQPEVAIAMLSVLLERLSRLTDH